MTSADDDLSTYFPLVWSIAKSFSVSANECFYRHSVHLKAASRVRFKSPISKRLDSSESDAYAEGLLHLVRARNTFDSSRGATFATWVRVCVTTGLIAWQKKRSTRKLPAMPDGLDVIEPSQLDWAVVDRLRDAVRLFDHAPRDREILQRRLSGETCREIAPSFGVSHQRIDQIWHRDILPVLRQHLGVHAEPGEIC